MPESKPEPNVLGMAARIVAAHVAHNTTPIDRLPDLIRSVYAALNSAGAAPPVEEQPVPAVSIKKSVFPDYLVCLEDGQKLKMLKRHLQSAYGMTPEDYRAKWGLAATYPMVAPNYAAHRSTLAKENGLGRRAAAPAEPEVRRIPAGVRGRKPGRPKRPVETVVFPAE